MIFLTAPKDLQETLAYERALELLRKKHEGEKVVADRSLFEDNRHYRKSWKQVYGKARKLYVLAREDGTVGAGIYKQWRYLDRRGVPSVVLFAEGDGGLARMWGYERFGLEPLVGEQDGEGEEDLVRFAQVGLSTESSAVRM